MNTHQSARIGVLGPALWVVIVLIPAEYMLPTLFGIGPVTAMLMLLGYLVIIHKPAAMIRVFSTGLMLTALAFVVVCALSEALRTNPSFAYVSRCAQMFAAAAIVASTVRSATDLRRARAAIMMMGLWVSIYLLLSRYTVIAGASAESFADANRVRASAYENSPLHHNLNALGFFTALGALAALAWALTSRGPRAYLLWLVAGLQFLACTLTLSRDSASIAVAVALLMLVMAGPGSARARLIGVAILGGVAFFAPTAFTARFFGSQIASSADARAMVWDAVTSSFPDYVWLGTGEGPFMANWGAEHGFMRSGVLLGAHNAYAQVWIYYGLLGFLALVAVLVAVWHARVAIARSTYPLDVNLLVTSWAVLFTLRLVFTHVLYDKVFAILLGLILGALTCARVAMQQSTSRPGSRAGIAPGEGLRVTL